MQASCLHDWSASILLAGTSRRHFREKIGTRAICPLRGSAAVLCGKAEPFRKAFLKELEAMPPFPRMEAQPQYFYRSSRKGKAFPHITAAKPPTFVLSSNFSLPNARKIKLKLELRTLILKRRPL